jgi:serine/threonine-protein kinase
MSRNAPGNEYRFGRFAVQPVERRLLGENQNIPVGPRAFDLLVALIDRAGHLVTKEELIEQVWPNLVVEENNLQVQVSALRKILGPETIATVPGRGYRFTVAVTPAESQTFPPLAQAFPAIDVRTPSIAVLPFVNLSDDVANEYFADGLAEELLNVLSKIRGLKVVSRTSSFYFKGRNVDLASVGQKLNVAAVVQGSVRKSGTRARITAQLIQVATDSHLWSETYDRELDDIFAVQDDIARSVVKELRAALLGEGTGSTASAIAAAEVQAAVTGRTDNPEAYRLYLKGRSFRVGNQQEMDKSVDYFQQTVARAPHYAMAYAGLAEVYTTQAYLRAVDRTEAVGKARAAVTRALELDPDLAEAHTALGLIRFYFEWDWSGADIEFRRALELNPGSQAVHEEYGNFLGAMGRLDEGLARSQEAARLDPLSVGPAHNIAINALIRGDYELAAAGFRHTIDIDPNWTWGYIKLARTLALQQDCKEAFAQAEIAERRIAGGAAPLSWSWLGVTYATCGDTARARDKLDQLHALEKKQYVDPVTFAEIHCALGEMDEALRWYEKAFADRTPNMVYAAILPRFCTGLAADPRFKAILDRMGFPQSGS